jgi:hypothetical protein
LEIKTLQNTPRRDADKLERLLKAKERKEAGGNTHRRYTKRLVTEIEMLKPSRERGSGRIRTKITLMGSVDYVPVSLIHRNIISLVNILSVMNIQDNRASCRS